MAISSDAEEKTVPQDVDPGALLAHVTGWADRFHDDSSPASVTDVLVAFAFIARLRFASSRPAATDALVRRMEQMMPAVGKHARLLTSTLLDSPAWSIRENQGAGTDTR